MVQMMEASVLLRADGSQLMPDVNRYGEAVESAFEAVGKRISTKMIDTAAIRSRMKEVTDIFGNIKSQMNFEFNLGKMGVDQAKSALSGISHEVDVIKAQMAAAVQAKASYLQKNMGMSGASASVLASQHGAGYAAIGATSEQLAMIAKLDSEYEKLAASAAEAGAREAQAAARATQLTNEQRVAVEALTAAENRDKAAAQFISDTANMRLRNTAIAEKDTSTRVAREEEVARRIEAVYARNASRKQFFADQDARMGEAHQQDMDRRVEAAVRKTRAAGGAGAKGAGGGFGVGNQMAIQASYGLQDFVTVMAGGGSFQQAMIGATNNIGMMFMNIDKLEGGFKGLLGSIRANQGAMAGLAISTLAVTIPVIIEKGAELWDNTTAAALKYKGAIDRIQQAHRMFEHGRESGAHQAQTVFELGLRANQIRGEKGGNLDEREGARHAFRAEDKRIEQQIEQAKGADVGDAERVKKNAEEQENLDFKLKSDSARRILERSKFDRRTGRVIAGKVDTQGDVDQAIGFVARHGGVLQNLDDAKKAEIERQLQALKDETDLTQAAITSRKEYIAKLEAAREAIKPDLEKEQSANIAEKKRAFDKIFDHRQEETGNEFQNRRNRVDRAFAEEIQEIEKANKEGLFASDPKERWRRTNEAGERGNAAEKEVDKDEKSARSRFMRGMEAAQKGTGSVHAVEDKLKEDLEKAEKLWSKPEDAPQLKIARQQALDTAQSEERRLAKATRPKGGQFFSPEQYSQHLMSELAGGDPDQKAINKNTFDALPLLQKIIDNTANSFGLKAK